MSKQILHRQLEGLSDLRRFLNGFGLRITEFNKEYKDVLNQLDSAGVPQEVINSYFYSYRRANTETLESISNNISWLDIPYIDNNINQINNTINASKR